MTALVEKRLQEEDEKVDVDEFGWEAEEDECSPENGTSRQAVCRCTLESRLAKQGQREIPASLSGAIKVGLCAAALKEVNHGIFGSTG